MMKRMAWLLFAALLAALPATAQERDGPLRIEITEGVIEPLPYAIPDFVGDGASGAEWGQRIARVIASDLSGTGLFREIPADAHIGDLSVGHPDDPANRRTQPPGDRPPRPAVISRPQKG